MVDVRQVCGTRPITYPSECTYVCICTPNSGCSWSVKCGDWITSGTGLAADVEPGHPHDPQVAVHGSLESAAELLSRGWKRKVMVPSALKGTVIKRKRTIKGTPEQIAKALGLELAPRGKAKGAKPKAT